ncbi:chemotaxis protein CheA [Terrilactibacillus sp. BCM23-1]|uniref:Chemotaxis protein CheA n=1 Tax=Terrilactibacillus tamarindi TaxID=2599694 RepID=A0A6N8CRJ0_9BACI|nr:chemotaxis protein CheA [Terrilactibacillus tamarindi]MTT32258.1 chemotaxis protein CheA [Terrilactibacillus tamarindi]
MDTNQYLVLFIDEGREHLQNLNDKMLALENDPNDLSVVNEIFRSAHTIKGMSASMGFEDMANLTHKMENVLDALRHKQIDVTPDMIDALFESIDHLEAMLDQIIQGQSDKRDVSDIVRKLQALEKGEAISNDSEQSASKSKNGAVESKSKNNEHGALNETEWEIVSKAKDVGLSAYFIKVNLTDDCMLKAARAVMVFQAIEGQGDVIKTIPDSEKIEKAEFDLTFSFIFITGESPDKIKHDILTVSEIDQVEIDEITQIKAQENIIESHHQTEKKETNKPKSTAPVQVNKTIRVNLDRLDHLLNLFEELIIDRGRLEQISNEVGDHHLKSQVEKIHRVSNQLQETILNLRMVPVETVFNRFPRMVRNLSKELNKKIELVITGADTEVDRSIVDELGDPLVHLLRNSLDHGIELPEVRKENGKSETGTVQLRAFHSGNHVMIEIEDDGAGIDRQKITAKAIENGLITLEASSKLSDQDVFHLMFASGFSTAEKISDISGRGVGLDVVQSNIRKIGGTVSVESTLGKGSRFTVKLPLTLSIINAMLIKLGEETYAVPISSIVETMLLRQIELKTVNKKEVLIYRDAVVPFIDLRNFLQVPHSDSEASKQAVIIVKQSNNYLAFAVDELLGHQDIVIKSLGNYLKNVEGISGATILGDGRVALILDCEAIA